MWNTATASQAPQKTRASEASRANARGDAEVPSRGGATVSVGGCAKARGGATAPMRGGDTAALVVLRCLKVKEGMVLGLVYVNNVDTLQHETLINCSNCS